MQGEMNYTNSFCRLSIRMEAGSKSWWSRLSFGEAGGKLLLSKQTWQRLERALVGTEKFTGPRFSSLRSLMYV